MATAAKPSMSIDTQSALAAQAALAAGQPNGAGESSGVDKMRELLFGNQMQDYDKRFSNRSPASSARKRTCAPTPTRSWSAACATTPRRSRSGWPSCRTSWRARSASSPTA